MPTRAQRIFDDEPVAPRRSGLTGILTGLVVVLALALAGGAAAIYFGLIPLARSPAAPMVAQAQAPLAQGPAEQQTATPAAAPAQQAESGLIVSDQQMFGDWAYGCVSTATDTAKVCSILQQLNDPQSNALLMQWRIARNPDGTIVSSWQTPTGVQVARGIVLEAGTPEPIAVPYTACMPGNCSAVANLAEDFQATLAVTTAIRATIFAVDGRGMVFTFSPTGLSDALAALNAAP